MTEPQFYRELAGLCRRADVRIGQLGLRDELTGTATVPEPASIVMVLMGAAALGAVVIRK